MIGVGVIGYGYWGPNLARNFAENVGARLVAIADRHEARRALATRRHPLAAILSDGLELIARTDVDAVIVATPVRSHFDLTMAALQAGKHVLVEKPLADSSDKATGLASEARARGLTLLVDHTFIYTGAVGCIREMARSGELGDLYYYDSTRINLGLFQPDVSVLWDLAVHDLSIMDDVLGQHPTAVSAHGISHVEGHPVNLAYLTLRFPGRLIAHLHVNWLAPVKIRQTLIGGSKRMIVYDDLEASEKVRVYDKGITLKDAEDGASIYKMVAYRRTGDMIAPRLNMTEALEVEAEHFLRCIRGEEAPRSGGDQGVRLVRILEAAEQSLREDGRWVSLV
jgi:predicted dehydrogenase